MILIYTDFGWQGPYIGQMQTVLRREAADVPVINLMADAPTYNPEAAAHLLAALLPEIPEGAVLLGVVDPGVGSHRDAVILEADGRRYVGPDNGLFEVVASRARHSAWKRITWRPARLSASFHGRDFFAPVAARLARGESVACEPVTKTLKEGRGKSLSEIIYIDGFGNAMTGIQGTELSPESALTVGGHRVGWARTFSDVAEGAPFWYENSLGLVEVAANRARAADILGLTLGTPVIVCRDA